MTYTGDTCLHTEMKRHERKNYENMRTRRYRRTDWLELSEDVVDSITVVGRNPANHLECRNM